MVMSVQRDFRAWGSVPFFSEDKVIASFAPRGRVSRFVHHVGAVASIALGVLLWIEVWKADAAGLSLIAGGASVALFALGMHLIERVGSKARRRIT